VVSCIAEAGTVLYAVSSGSSNLFNSLVIYFLALFMVAFVGVLRSWRLFGSLEAEAFGFKWDFPGSLGRIGVGVLSAGLILFMVSGLTKVYAYVPLQFFSSFGNTVAGLTFSFLFYMFVVALVENSMCFAVADSVMRVLPRGVFAAFLAILFSAGVLSSMHFAAYGFADLAPYVFAFFAFGLWMFMYFIFGGDIVPGIVSHGWYDFCVVLGAAGLSLGMIFLLTTIVGGLFLSLWLVIGMSVGRLTL